MYRALSIRPAIASGMAALSLAVGISTGAMAADITNVQLGFVDSGSNLCPRIVTMKAWAHLEGPGVVNFVIRNSSGTKTGSLPAQAVKGPAGNWIATMTREIKITTDVDTKYVAEVKGSSKISNWVPLKEACLGKAPQTTGYTRPGRHISELDKDEPKPQGDGKPIPGNAGGGKPLPGNSGGGKPLPGNADGGKPLPQCSSKTVSAKRILAATRAGGIATAWIAWENSVSKTMGANYARYLKAKNRNVDCKWAGTFTCTVSANPCRS